MTGSAADRSDAALTSSPADLDGHCLRAHDDGAVIASPEDVARDRPQLWASLLVPADVRAAPHRDGDAG